MRSSIHTSDEPSKDGRGPDTSDGSARNRRGRGSAPDNVARRAGGRQVKRAEEYICDVQCIHPELVEDLEGKALDWGMAADLSEIFRVMSDPTRLRIISLLALGELCVCDIASALNMTQSAVSHQLRVLRVSDLVKVRKEGRVAWYSLDDDHVLKLFTQGLDHVGHSE